jgi:hypothetical protein
VSTSTATAFQAASFAISWHHNYYLPLLVSTSGHQQSTMVAYGQHLNIKMIVEYVLHQQSSFVCPIWTYLSTRAYMASIGYFKEIRHSVEETDPLLPSPLLPSPFFLQLVKAWRLHSKCFMSSVFSWIQ